MTTARQRTNQKGYATMRMARRMFEERGGLLEPARNIVRWINGKPRSLRHDFFNVWDAVVIFPTAWAARSRNPMARRIFIQVTSVDHMSHRREKILGSDFPCSPFDLVLGYRGNRKFRVLRGPRFDGEAEEWVAPRPPKVDKGKAGGVSSGVAGGDATPARSPRRTTGRASHSLPTTECEVS